MEKQTRGIKASIDIVSRTRLDFRGFFGHALDQNCFMHQTVIRYIYLKDTSSVAFIPQAEISSFDLIL